MKNVKRIFALVLVLALVLCGCGKSGGDAQGSQDETISNMQGLLQEQQGSDTATEEAPAEEAPEVEIPFEEEASEIEIDESIPDFSSNVPLYEDSYFVCTYDEMIDAVNEWLWIFDYEMALDGFSEGDADFVVLGSDGDKTAIWGWMPLIDDTDDIEEIYMVMPYDCTAEEEEIFACLVTSACSVCDPDFDWDAMYAEFESTTPEYDDDGNEFAVFSYNDVYYMISMMSDGSMVFNIY